MLKKLFWPITTFIILNLFLVLFFYQERDFSGLSKEIAVQFKANFLKDSVTNFIHEFERNKADSVEIFDFTVSERENSLRNEFERTRSPQEGINVINKIFNQNDIRDMWSYVLVSSSDGKILASQSMPEDWDHSERSLNNIFCSWRLIETSYGKFYFGVTQEHLYNTMISIVSSKVHNSHFVEETYYWINEIKNYKGGKDYAVRLIHPNPRSSEGMLLSTDMQDAIGDLPYERELEGINKDGETFNIYYFKKKDSDNFARKITYSKLYKPYNWIVCMGSYYDDIYGSVDAIKKMKNKSGINFFIYIIIFCDLLLLLYLSVRIYSEKKEELALHKQTNIDPLTEANTKDFGIKELKQKFTLYKITRESPALMFMDVDNFKTINDTDGRDTGDYILSQLVNIFRDQSRASDIIIRWDGDRFLAIFEGMKKAACWHYSQKLLESISSKKFTYKNKSVQATVSLGFSFFDENDKNFAQGLERAKKALKEAKNAGKNRARVE
ncbi:MAG: diguanylate cyclase [Treponema sp.]|nr:diguanylate cyclase [Treponema sp.]